MSLWFKLDDLCRDIWQDDHYLGPQLHDGLQRLLDEHRGHDDCTTLRQVQEVFVMLGMTEA